MRANLEKCGEDCSVTWVILVECLVYYNILSNLIPLKFPTKKLFLGI
jgi:hypothetical protein